MLLLQMNKTKEVDEWASKIAHELGRILRREAPVTNRLVDVIDIPKKDYVEYIIDFSCKNYIGKQTVDQTLMEELD